MDRLTRAEEEIMKCIWSLEKGFLKDIVEVFPEPKPAYPTIASVIRVLIKKGFIAYKQYGNNREYYPKITKSEYFRIHFKNIVTNHFNNSYKSLVSFFADDDNLSISELEEIKNIANNNILKRKKA